MKDAWGRATSAGDLKRLVQLYQPTYAYLREGKIATLWEDNILGEKDTTRQLFLWRNAQIAPLRHAGVEDSSWL